MKKIETIEMIKEIISLNKETYNHDKPAIRETYNNMIDSLNKDGSLTDNQADRFYLLDRELKQLLNIAKGL
jgi:polyhydroxyalkanoate synthesis regulator phasin